MYNVESTLFRCRVTEITYMTYSNATVAVSSEQFVQTKNYCDENYLSALEQFASFRAGLS